MSSAYKKRKGWQTILPYKGYNPGADKKAKRDALREQTFQRIDARVDAYIRANPAVMEAAGGSQMWATPVRYHYTCMITGESPSRNIPLDTDTKRMVWQWAQEACAETGWKIPQAAPKKKRKKK